MPLLLFTSLVLLAIVLVYVYFKWRYFSSSHDDPPGTEPQIFLGNLLNSGVLTGRSFHEVLIDFQQRYGDIFLFWFGQYRCPVFCLPEHAQTIFADRHTFEQSPLFALNFDLLCPHGIITLTGAKWKRHTRVMLPMFKRAKVVPYLETIVECTDRFIDRHFDDGLVHIDILLRCQSLLMNIIGRIAFDYDLDDAINSSVTNAIRDFNYYTKQLLFATWLPRWLYQLYFKLNWKYQEAHRRVREFTEEIVEREQNKQDEREDQRPKNLIASFISSLNEQANDENASSGLTRAEIFDEILMIILAGYETTSTALCWFIFYMSKHPRVHQRIKQELREKHLLMTDDGCVPALTQEILDSLVYCECVIKEVLRLAPVAGLTTRIATRDTVVDGVPVRRGQTLFVALYNMNTDRRYWHHADPTQFVPERFLAEDKHHHSYAMVPFGGGHRACIGQDLAWFELKVIIVRLMQRGVTFEYTPENTGGYSERATCLPKPLAVRVHIDRH